MLVLELFPGISLFGRAFEEEGFTVVRGPDLLWGGDIRDFHPPAGRFDGVIGGPPCQAFSRLVHIVRANGHQVAENLIPEFARCVAEAAPRWFLMENVPDAPMPVVPDYRVSSRVINNRWFAEPQNRERRFSWGAGLGVWGEPWRHLETAALESPDYAPAVTANGGLRSVPVRLLQGGKVKRRVTAGDLKIHRSYAEMLRLQGLPEDFLAEAPFTVAGKIKVVGNGVPLPMGRALARAVKAALEPAS